RASPGWGLDRDHQGPLKKTPAYLDCHTCCLGLFLSELKTSSLIDSMSQPFLDFLTQKPLSASPSNFRWLALALEDFLRYRSPRYAKSSSGFRPHLRKRC
ncbi:hypothetical protein OAG84_04060, partial [Akkermansiaceae bacterium]|nr:hypothetical protein [Akkermansiaceae bacterium]